MSDLLVVEKIPKVGDSPVLTYKIHQCFNHISLLKQRFVAYKVGLYIKVTYYMYKPV